MIDRIVKRAIPFFIEAGFAIEPADLAMDIAAVHASDCPLHLAALLASSDATFAHDVSGIHCFLDRATGALTNHFLPRCAA
ncbi:MAG: hypothetical protein HQL60_07800 [Magnetococcales bacterium]|nr:hypothetical protein [Magnetococcales bacterium]